MNYFRLEAAALERVQNFNPPVEEEEGTKKSVMKGDRSPE